MLELTEEQKFLKKTARDFAAREIAPNASAWDEKSEYPRDLVRKLGETGLMGVTVPADFGGAGMDAVSYGLALEEIAAADASISVMVSVHNSLVCEGVLKFASDALKQEYLPALAAGRMLGCFALSEPDAGSDAGSLKTRATRQKDLYVLNGVKNFITSGSVADLSVVFATVDPAAGRKGITAFVVETGTPGYRAGPAERKMGLRASPTTSVYLEDCCVPAANVLGKEGEGFKIALSLLDCGRIGIATQAVGIARAAFEAAVRYSKVRKQFGRSISQFQSVQWMLADMATRVDAARLMTFRAAALRSAGKPFVKEASMAKLFASEVANEVVTKAVQVFGGYGYTKDYPVEKYFRDGRATEIYEGTSEIQRLVIAREILKEIE